MPRACIAVVKKYFEKYFIISYNPKTGEKTQLFDLYAFSAQIGVGHYSSLEWI